MNTRNKSAAYLIFGLLLIGIILISGCIKSSVEKINDLNLIYSENISHKNQTSQEKENADQFELSASNVSIDKKQNTSTIYSNEESAVSSSEEVNQTEQTETANDNSKPVLKNLGINIESWDRNTNKAGDFLFENKEYVFKNYVDDKIFTEFGLKTANNDGREKLLPEIGFNVPVGTKVISPINGVITDIKFYEPSQDYLISMKADESSPLMVGFEHIYNLRIKVGDKVLVGQELAEVSPSYGRTEFGNVEINIWTGGQNIYKYCPFEFLDEPLKPIYERKLNQLANDWEEFLGKDIYKQEEWVSPGCLLHNITER
ncbi:MAG: hypothetical protein Q7S22_00905 [Candidatus Micrarchaeota archaeon]|nr:hypothetical protein [Candidatus Micrarchaeota archaeon]